MKSETLISPRHSPLFSDVSRLAGKAIVDFSLIEEGDRIAVAVSGGKDSLSLLHIMRDRKRISPVDFEFCAVHIDFELSDFNPAELVRYLKKEGFSYMIERVDSLKGERFEDIDCYRWSRQRRKALFQLANTKGFTKIAFGHHMDDIVETILLNQFYRGEIGAMKPRQELFGGKIVIIRPLAYVRESHMLGLAKQLGIDSMGQSKCAFDDESQRMKIKNMLKSLEMDRRGVVKNIFNSLGNIQEDYLIEKSPKAPYGSHKRNT